MNRGRVSRHAGLASAFVLAAALATAAQSGQRPDYSGRWTFDRTASAQPAADGRQMIAPLLGDEFVARQDAVSLTLDITAGARRVTAVYRLDGGDSRNLSPGASGEPGIEVVSQAFWVDGRLHITSQSTSAANGESVTVKSTRVLWLDGPDRLILERSGTPVALVPSTRSVYRRVSR
jgi:hypothetical protein